MYRMVRITGMDKDLLIHTVRVIERDTNMVELTLPGDSIMLTREQVQQMTQWIEQEFELLAKEAPATVH